MLISLSSDNYLRIWLYPEIIQVCSLNIQHPIPIQWDINDSYFIKIDNREKIENIYKELSDMKEKYENKLSF